MSLSELGERVRIVPFVVFLIATAAAIGVNIVASHLSYNAMEAAIGWAGLAYLAAIVPVWFVPLRYVPSEWALVLGGWVVAIRFTGDMGQSHESGVFLILALLAFSFCLSAAMVLMLPSSGRTALWPLKPRSQK